MQNNLQTIDEAVYGLDITKVNDAIQHLTKGVEEGLINPLELLTKIRATEKVLNGVLANIKDQIVTEALKYGKEPIIVNGVEMKIQEAGVKYDYSKCNHPEYNILVNQKNHISDKMRDIEAILKANKTSWEHVDTMTGETFTIYPPIKTSTTTVITKIK
jgi:hypothetical protein